MIKDTYVLISINKYKKVSKEFDNIDNLNEYLHLNNLPKYEDSDFAVFLDDLTTVIKINAITHYGLEGYDVDLNTLSYLLFKGQEMLVDFTNMRFFKLTKENGKYNAKELSVSNEASGYRRIRVADNRKVAISNILKTLTREDI